MKRIFEKSCLLILLLGIVHISYGQSVCDGTAFFSLPNGSSADMYRFNTNNSQFEPFATGLPYVNATGFNPIDNNIYGFGQGEQVIRIALDGQATILGPVQGLVTGGLWAGCMSPSGTYFLTGNVAQLYEIDISGATPILLNEITKFYVNDSGTGTPSFGDIVIDPTTGILYGYDDNVKKLATIDPANGAVDAFGLYDENFPVIGGMVADAQGELYCFYFGEFYHINKTTGAFTYLYDAPDNNGGIDACSCPYYIDLTKSTENESVCAGDTIIYEFSIFNSSQEAITGVSFMDTLPSPFVIISDPMNLMGGSISVNSGAGYDQINITNMSISEGESNFQFQVKVPEDINQEMTLSNQATMVGFSVFLPAVLKSDDPKTLEIDDPTEVFVSPNVELELDLGTSNLNCEGDTVTIYAQSGEEEGSYQWSNLGGFLSEGAELLLPDVSLEQAGVYTLNYTSASGCVADTFVTIEITAGADVDLGKDSSLCLTNVLRISPGTYSAYKWQDGSTGHFFLVENYGSYSVVVTNEYGCETQDTIVFSSNCPTQIYLPNAFSPNGDGVNDVLQAYGLEVIEFRLRIFDRWGEEVFFTEDILAAWDGSFLGKPMGSGVYAYLLEASFLNGGVLKESGDVSLLR